MKLLRSINLLCVALSACMGSAQSMNKNSSFTQRKEELNRSLWYACRDIDRPATWVEKAQAALHCKSVMNFRLAGIEDKLVFGANVHHKIKDKKSVNDVKDDEADVAPIHLAVKNGNPQLAELLLKYKANPNQLIKETGIVRGVEDGEVRVTPLHLAIINFDSTMVRLLLRYKADVHQPALLSRHVYFKNNWVGNQYLFSAPRTMTSLEMIESYNLWKNQMTKKVNPFYQDLFNIKDIGRVLIHYGAKPQGTLEESFVKEFLGIEYKTTHENKLKRS